MNEYIEKYYNFRSRVDSEVCRLEKLHGNNIVCRQGCIDCCVNLTVFPIEFFSILEDIKSSDLKPVLNESAGCGFLDARGGCMIYPYRPIICRTHGLPIAFRDCAGDVQEAAVSFCDKNFTAVDMETYAFDSGNTLNIDSLNEILYELNSGYIRQLEDESLGAYMRIELRQLVEFM